MRSVFRYSVLGGVGTVLIGLSLAAAMLFTGGRSPPPIFALHDSPRPLPELSFKTGRGKTLRLADFRGKVILLNIWATWCVPCRKEMPTLDRLQAKLGSSGFEVVALSIDRAGTDIVKKFYTEIGLKHLAVYIDRSGKTPRDLRIVGIPTTLLIARDGREIGRLVGPKEWDAPGMVAFLKARIESKTGIPILPRSRLEAMTVMRVGKGFMRHPAAALTNQIP